MNFYLNHIIETLKGKMDGLIQKHEDSLYLFYKRESAFLKTTRSFLIKKKEDLFLVTLVGNEDLSIEEAPIVYFKLGQQQSLKIENVLNALKTVDFENVVSESFHRDGSRHQVQFWNGVTYQFFEWEYIREKNLQIEDLLLFLAYYLEKIKTDK